jgi:hypothetical protein
LDGSDVKASCPSDLEGLLSGSSEAGFPFHGMERANRLIDFWFFRAFGRRYAALLFVIEYRKQVAGVS